MSLTIKPLFLLALGLHGLLLLLPMGGASDADLVENVPLSEQPDEAAAEAEATLDPSALKANTAPSAIENVALAAPKPTALSPTATAILSTVRPAPVAGSGAAVRPAPRPVPAAAPSPQPAAPQAALLDFSSQVPAQNSPSPARPNPAPGVSASPTPPATPAASPARSPVRATNSQSPSVASLIASASGKVSDSLRSLSAFFTDGLIYSAEGTDDLSASQKHAAWVADIRRQASGEGIEDVELRSVADLIRLNYPIESAKKEEGRSLNLCLDPAPHSAEIGILFDSQGNIVAQPELVRSTGYSALNDEIMAAVAEYDAFPADRQSKAYSFEVAVDYDAAACVSLESLRR